MSLKDQKILKTLELLVMLLRSKQQFSHGQSDEEKATLTITKQLITDSGLTVPEFTNSVHAIAEKGYLWHVVIFDNEERSQMNEFINSDQRAQVLEKLKELDTKENSDKLKKSTIEMFGKILPHGVELDQQGLDNEQINFSELVNEGIQAFQKMRPDEIAFVILMPFRDINTLLSKMNAGEKFEDIHDDGFWYDQNKFEFHIDDAVISTSYQEKPNLEHYVIKEFFNDTKLRSLVYENLIEYDIARGEEAYRDAMRRFVDKHPSLSRLFTVHKYQTKFHPDWY